MPNYANTKSQLAKQLNQLARQYKADITSALSDWDDTPSAVAKRRTAGDFKSFLQTYFPHYLRHDSQSKLHRYLHQALPDMLADKDGQMIALAAPRGEAKSTIVTRLFSLYCIAHGLKRYIVIISDTYGQAADFLEAIKAELEANTRLKTDFPDAFGVGRVWRHGEILTTNGVKVRVAGAGKSLRGFVHGAYRPDLVILDDLENDKNVHNPTQRDKLENWLKSAVLKLGVAGEKFDVVYIGTILHHDSVLNRILNNKGWQTQVFKALIRYPNRMDLWDEYEAIFHGTGMMAAQDFYLANKTVMDEGAVVSWDSRPLLALMKIRARDGHRAFDTELQNDPTAGDDAPFANAIHYWTNLPSDLIYFGACDPSLGKGGSRDPSAIVVAGLDKTTGKVYIVHAAIAQRVPDRIISDIIACQQRYGCQHWVIETVAFQEFLYSELIRRGAMMGVPIPAHGIKPNHDKQLRIESLQPYMANGLLLLHHEQKTLIDQFRHFPHADHDDGCDATEMVYKLAISHQQTARAIDLPPPTGWH